MGLFAKIWEKDPEKIRDFIEKANADSMAHQKKLSEIVLHCNLPELRKSAIKKLTNPEIQLSTFLEARKQGDLESVRTFIDNSSAEYIIYSRFFDPVVQAADYAALSMLALRIKTIEEWNQREKQLAPLLSLDGFVEAKQHYEALRKTDEDRKKKELEQQKKEEAEKREQEFLRSPRKALTKAQGTPKEKKLWEKWYGHEFSSSPNGVIQDVLYSLHELNWAAFFPAGKIKQAITERNISYEGEGCFRRDWAEHDLTAFLGTLYASRADLREEILALDNLLFYKGTQASTVNFGDHHEDWHISFDAIPAYRMTLRIEDREKLTCIFTAQS